MNKLYMFITNIVLIVIAIAISLFFSTVITNGRFKPALVDGVYDMSSFSFDNNSRYPISNYFTLIDTYDETSIYEGKFLLPNDLDNLAIRIPPVDGSLELYINDTKMYDRTVEDAHSIVNTPQIINYALSEGERLVTVRFICMRIPLGTFPLPPLNPIGSRDFLIGSLTGIHFFQNMFVLFDLVLLSICLITTAFHFIAYLYRNITKIHAYFSIFSLSSIICLSLSSQHMLNNYLHNIPIELNIKIMMIGYFLRLLSLLKIEKVSFVSILRQKAYNFVYISNFVVLILALLAPIPYVNYIQAFYPILVSFSILLAINEAFISYRYEKKTSTKAILVGFVLLLIGSVSDFVYLLSISKVYLTFYTTQIIFILIQSVITSIDYTNLLKINQLMSADLKQKVFEYQEIDSTYIISHINPKYVYDILDAIKNNIDVNQDRVDTLIQSISKYLRHTFDYLTKEKIYPYTEELDLCYAYKNIVNSKYPGIKFEFDIAENLPVVDIPMFSIFSLMENSVLHAFKQVLHPEIKITVRLFNEFVEFSVYDNGIGMSKDEISYILDHPHAQVTYGIYQTNHLLIDKCQSKLQINSTINKNTVATFLIPIDHAEQGVEV